MVGFPVLNRESISPVFFCNKCDLLLDQPRQTPCGHRFCQSCIDVHDEKTLKCPSCQCKVIKEKIFIDRGIINDMKLLQIECKWCRWLGVFKDYSAHLQTCHSSPKCPYCSLDLNTMVQLEKHLRETCTRPGISCSPGVSSDSNSNDTATCSQEHSPIIPNHSSMTRQNLRVAKKFSYRTRIADSSAVLPLNDNLNLRSVSPLPAPSGKYIWRIEDVEKKIQNAENRCPISIDSPSFYSPQRHKLCLRLYLHGDESVRSRYASLFVVLMKGEFDDLIPFPFQKKVLLCLYDQTEQRNHKIAGFLPDARSTSFNRPSTEKNVASGIPNFCPSKMIREVGNNYVRDNTMFIKVLICDRDIPEAAVRTIMSIDPALPDKIHDAEKQRIISQAIQQENDDINSLICTD